MRKRLRPAYAAAVARAQDAGGQLLQGSHEVPGGSWIAYLMDLQGVVFAITGPKV